MNLTAEHFIQIVTSLSNEPGEEGSGQDHRRQPRAAIRSHATIIPFSDSAHTAAILVQVRDLSQAGIGFLHEQKMSLDQQFALVLPRESDTPSVVLCSVAFWQPLAGNIYAIGARFRRILRDGGNPPLPDLLKAPAADLASEIIQLHRKAG